MIEEALVPVSQLRGIVRERNEYRRLLDECLHALNLLPNRRIQGDLNTYGLASIIEDTFRRFK